MLCYFINFNGNGQLKFKMELIFNCKLLIVNEGGLQYILKILVLKIFNVFICKIIFFLFVIKELKIIVMDMKNLLGNSF